MAIVKVKNLATEPDKQLVVCPKCGNKGELVLFKPLKHANINHKLGLDDGQVALLNGERLQALAPTWQPLEFCPLKPGEWEHLVPAEKKRAPSKTANKSILSFWEEVSGSKASSAGSSKKGRKPRPRISTHKPRPR
jgi:hypothetical protein